MCTQTKEERKLHSMDEYIKREPLLSLAKQWEGQTVGLPVLLTAIKNAPTADVAEVRHGEWIPHEFEQVNGYDIGYKVCYCYQQPTCYHCSLCGRIEEFQEPYCNCGAKMDGKGDTE